VPLQWQALLTELTQNSLSLMPPGATPSAGPVSLYELGRSLSLCDLGRSMPLNDVSNRSLVIRGGGYLAFFVGYKLI